MRWPWLRRRNRRAYLTDIENDANRRLAESTRIAAAAARAHEHAQQPSERVEKLRQTSERLAAQNRIGGIIRDSF